MLRLYNSPTSTCSQKVRLCLAEKNLPYENHWVITQKNEHLTPEYLAINPNGVVPSLIHDDKVILDSSVICEYLDEVFSETNLTPQDAHGRARMRAWMRFLEEVPTTAIRVPSFHLSLLKRFTGIDNATFQKEQADIRPLRKYLFRLMTPEGFSKKAIEESLERLDLTLKRMEGALSTGPWLMGDQFTLADIIVIPTIDRMADLNLAYMWTSRYPRVTAWYVRVRERPSFDAVYAKGARLSEVYGVGKLDIPRPAPTAEE